MHAHWKMIHVRCILFMRQFLPFNLIYNWDGMIILPWPSSLLSWRFCPRNIWCTLCFFSQGKLIKQIFCFFQPRNSSCAQLSSLWFFSYPGKKLPLIRRNWLIATVIFTDTNKQGNFWSTSRTGRYDWWEEAVLLGCDLCLHAHCTHARSHCATRMQQIISS